MKVGAICDEENDICLDEPDDSLCENGLFCDGCPPEQLYPTGEEARGRSRRLHILNDLPR